jgi:hypothetical protein
MVKSARKCRYNRCLGGVGKSTLVNHWLRHIRKEVSERLSQDVRRGVHAQKVMESYQTWFGEGPELSILRLLGLFDRPADEQAIAALLKSPAIPGLTESLSDFRPVGVRSRLLRSA